MSNAIVKPIPYTVDLNEPVKKTFIDTLLATEDNLAHCFDITLKRGGEAVTLPEGTAVTAYFIRYCDNATLPAITGTVSGNVISATLNKACYNKAGQFAIIIKAVAGEVTSTVFYGEGTIFTSITDTIIDTENVVPSLSDLLAQIAAMEEATAATKAATTNARTATTKANNAAAKIEGMTVSAQDADAAGATITEVDGVKHIAFDIPRGEKGEKGDSGTIENVTISSIDGLSEALAGKLGTNDTAADSVKLNGKDADEFLQKSQVVNNFTTSEEGFVADARAMKLLNDKVSGVHMRSTEANWGDRSTLKLTFGTVTGKKATGFVVINDNGSLYVGAFTTFDGLGNPSLHKIISTTQITPGIRSDETAVYISVGANWGNGFVIANMPFELNTMIP